MGGEVTVLQNGVSENFLLTVAEFLVAWLVVHSNNFVWGYKPAVG